QWTDNAVGTNAFNGLPYDFGTNGDVVVLPLHDELWVFEKDPAGTLTESSTYKTQCPAGTNTFYLDGDLPTMNAGGQSLANGSLLTQGTQTIGSGGGTFLVNEGTQNTLNFTVNIAGGQRWDLNFKTGGFAGPFPQEFGLGAGEYTFGATTQGAVGVQINSLTP